MSIGSFGYESSAIAQSAAPPPGPDDAYVPGPDSKPIAGVPKGQVFDFVIAKSEVFPGATHRVTVYVPSAYRAESPACVYVGLDGLAFEAPTVFDNLIYRHEIPVLIAIGISSGTVDSVDAPRNPRFNRSVEFDGMNDRLSRLVLNEILPEVERHKTPSGLPILLSRSGNDRAIGGASTGAIGAFTLAWERPDAFQRVFSAIGTYVGMRGGDRYPVLIRKTEPKPLRIFLQDGANDELTGAPEFGDWWLGNQQMASALYVAGYEITHVWGSGTHSGKHATAIFPDAMRWLWKEWPRAVRTPESSNSFLKAILIPGELWQSVTNSSAIPSSLESRNDERTTSMNGRIYGTDRKSGTVWTKHDSEPKIIIDSELKSPTAIAISPDGLWLAVAESESHWGYSYRIQRDGTVDAKQAFYWFHVTDDADYSGAEQWVADTEGRLYAATKLGVQIFDRNGRVRAILPVPGKEAIGIGFGSQDSDTLFVRSRNSDVYSRKIKPHGWSQEFGPIDLPKWGPG